MRVTAVVITYNGRELLDIVMPTLLAQTYRGFRVVVVDDGSADGTGDHVRSRWPEVELIEQPVNAGVAVALNRGLAAARGEYVALLNNDLELEPDWLERLVATLDAHPEAASATGKLLNFHRRGELDAAGDLMRWSGAPHHRGCGEPDRGQFDAPEAIFSPCAGAALYRLSAFAEVGCFDEDFFAYLEDVDWGFRAQLAGYSSRYEPGAVAYHMGGATTGRTPSRFVALTRRNQILVVVKNYPLAALVLHLPSILWHQGGWIVASIHAGTLRRHVGALASAVPALPGALRKRRAVQRGRRASLAELDAVMTPEAHAGATLIERVRSIASALSARP